LGAVLLVAVAIACGWMPVASAAAGQPAPGSPPLRIAVIGDYGDGSQAEADVAALVRSWNPDLVVTTGDNNYPKGEAATIDRHVGRYYSQFIAPYRGDFGPGAGTNRFFPSLGNHDWMTTGGRPPVPQPYLDYFTLPEGPGQERYYDFVWGPVQFFVVDSDYREPDGAYDGSAQAAWLQERLAASTAPWKLVVMHEPPYSSGFHGSSPRMRWPYDEWGASAVLAGHDHTYERVMRDGFPYFVNGLGSSSRYWFLLPVRGSTVRYNGDSGAMLIEATADRIDFRFVTRAGELIDSYTLETGSVSPAAREEQPAPIRPSKANPFLRPSRARVE
jgi:hypothetical protein